MIGWLPLEKIRNSWEVINPTLQIWYVFLFLSKMILKMHKIHYCRSKYWGHEILKTMFFEKYPLLTWAVFI